MEQVVTNIVDAEVSTEHEVFNMNSYDMNLSEMEEMEPLESPACIIGKYVFVSS